ALRRDRAGRGDQMPRVHQHARGVGQMRRAALIAAAVVVATSAIEVAPASRAQAPASADARYEQLAARVTEAMERYHVPGVALGVIDDVRTTTRGFGVTSVEDPHPVTAATVFPIASISKTFASTAIMRLVEQEKVGLRAPVRTYLPDFRVEDEAVSRDVTVWHLLTHTSGWEGQIAPADSG